MIRIILFLAAVTIGAAPAAAETYKWTDDSGTVNFSEDFSRIPKKYRKKARMIGDIGPGHLPDSPADGAEPEKRVNEGQPTATTAPDPAGSQKKNPALFGGKNGEEWSGEYRRLNDEIRSVRDRIADRKNRLANPDKMSRAQFLATQYEISELEGKLEELEGRLADLDRSASKAGVPYEFRK